MGYRNIVVDGVQYRYTVGKSHVKVRGISTVPLKGQIGSLVDMMCDCGLCDLSLWGASGSVEGEREQYQYISVLPIDVAKFIRENRTC